jgi:hypothetical protein
MVCCVYRTQCTQGTLDCAQQQSADSKLRHCKKDPQGCVRPGLQLTVSCIRRCKGTCRGGDIPADWRVFSFSSGARKPVYQFIFDIISSFYFLIFSTIQHTVQSRELSKTFPVVIYVSALQYYVICDLYNVYYYNVIVTMSRVPVSVRDRGGGTRRYTCRE